MNQILAGMEILSESIISGLSKLTGTAGMSLSHCDERKARMRRPTFIRGTIAPSEAMQVTLLWNVAGTFHFDWSHLSLLFPPGCCSLLGACYGGTQRLNESINRSIRLFFNQRTRSKKAWCLQQPFRFTRSCRIE
jgi:hypothetical protein